MLNLELVANRQQLVDAMATAVPLADTPQTHNHKEHKEHKLAFVSFVPLVVTRRGGGRRSRRLAASSAIREYNPEFHQSVS